MQLHMYTEGLRLFTPVSLAPDSLSLSLSLSHTHTHTHTHTPPLVYPPVTTNLYSLIITVVYSFNAVVLVTPRRRGIVSSSPPWCPAGCTWWTLERIHKHPPCIRWASIRIYYIMACFCTLCVCICSVHKVGFNLNSHYTFMATIDTT